MTHYPVTAIPEETLCTVFPFSFQLCGYTPHASYSLFALSISLVHTCPGSHLICLLCARREKGNSSLHDFPTQQACKVG